MTSQHSSASLLETVTRIAAQADPPPLAPAAGRQMIERALDAARSPARRSSSHRLGMAAVAIAAAAALVIALRWPSSTGPAPEAPGALAFTLPSGDRIAAEAGAEFALAAATEHDRRFELRRGTLRFVVRPLAPGERFEVTTPHLRARVVGTVFSVEVETDRTVVRVESGVVEVEMAGRIHRVAAGQSLDSATAPAAAPATATAPAPAFEDAPAPAPDSGTGTATGTGAGSATAAATGDPLARARRLLVAGRYQAVIDLARRHRGGEWRMVEGDALRALGRTREAIATYLAAIDQLDATGAASAGFVAARLQWQNGDPERALDALTESGADRIDSPLEERALGLRLRILVDSGRSEAARAVAARYLERFPQGSLADWAGKL